MKIGIITEKLNRALNKSAKELEQTEEGRKDVYRQILPLQHMLTLINDLSGVTKTNKATKSGKVKIVCSYTNEAITNAILKEFNGETLS